MTIDSAVLPERGHPMTCIQVAISGIRVVVFRPVDLLTQRHSRAASSTTDHEGPAQDIDAAHATRIAGRSMALHRVVLCFADEGGNHFFASPT